MYGFIFHFSMANSLYYACYACLIAGNPPTSSLVSAINKNSACCNSRLTTQLASYVRPCGQASAKILYSYVWAKLALLTDWLHVASCWIGQIIKWGFYYCSLTEGVGAGHIYIFNFDASSLGMREERQCWNIFWWCWMLEMSHLILHQKTKHSWREQRQN